MNILDSGLNASGSAHPEISMAVSPFGNEFFSRSLVQLILHIQKTTSGSGGSNPAKPVIH
ncbi:hypothetical protein ACQSEB_16250 [Salmonella enterica]|uniref:hypothetical protein n=1 Tax=Salmonella enterica TaxID=28901 RepID=UPI00127C9171|nr:hypothetical protein [Salmonella enterica subsp. diarizonae]